MTTPVYQELIQCASDGYSMLESDVQNEIRQFVLSQQDENGLFTARDGVGDWYYTLFGCWLLKALQFNIEENKISQGIGKNTLKTKSLIDKYAKELSRLVIQPSFRQSKLSLFTFFKKSNLNVSYKLFLFYLLSDAKGKSYRLHLKLALSIYKMPNDAPASFLAAMLFLKNKVSMKTNNLQALLMKHFDYGFSAFKEQKQADMLSTAVSLFALHKLNTDLRFIAPRCFNFIQNNYSSGAFIAGTGDYARDLEYTFYGLLALGSLNTKNRSTVDNEN